MCRTICSLLLLPLLSAGQTGPSLSGWNAVERIPAGERIEIQLLNNKAVKGRLDHATADAVYLLHGGKTIETRREQVQRLSRRRQGHGGRWALIGGLAGAGVLGGVYGPRLESGEGKAYGAAVAGTVALGAIIGAGVGYGLGRGKAERIYQAPKK